LIGLLQLTRFGAVGICCFALGLAVLVGVHDLAGANYLIAYVTSFVLSNVAGYLLNARFTFSVDSIHHRGAVRYLLVNTALLCVNTVVLKILVDGFQVWYVGAAVLLAAVNTPVSFAAQRFVTYRAEDGSRASGCQATSGRDDFRR